MRAIIVDDEQDTLQEIAGLVEQQPGFQLVGTYTNPLGVLPDLDRTRPDCAFVDIEMPGINGIDLAERLLERNPGMDIVFITAYNHYATEAFEVNALDYVLKPVHPDRLQKAVARMRKTDCPAAGPDTINVEIRTLGGFEVLAGGEPIRWNRSKARELLAYLLHFQAVKKNKQKICGDLWPDCEERKARINLQTAICALRKCLGEIGRNAITIRFSDDCYELRLGDVLYDAAQFEHLYDWCQANRDPHQASLAASLYRGDYLDGEDWPWSQWRAETLAAKHGKLMRMLAEDYFSQGKYEEAMEAAWKLLHWQASDDTVQRLLLDCAFRTEGMGGLAHHAKLLRQLCQSQFDEGLEPLAAAYCREKGLVQ